MQESDRSVPVIVPMMDIGCVLVLMPDLEMRMKMCVLDRIIDILIFVGMTVMLIVVTVAVLVGD